MVKILANGELVADDDPRVRSSAAPGRQQQSGSNVHSNIPQGGEAYRQVQSTSMFGMLNQRLVAAGIPSWNIGPYTVEPIVSAAFLLSLLFFGLQGLLFAGLLFFVVKYSGMGDGGGGGMGGPAGGRYGQGGNQGHNADGSRGNAFFGTGHRLGQS